MFCHVHLHHLRAARDIFNQLPESARDVPHTRFLMYKVAQLDNDPILGICAANCNERKSLTPAGAQCLQMIRERSTDDTFLYACVLEAQQSGDKAQGIMALQALVANISDAQHGVVGNPALYR